MIHGFDTHYKELLDTQSRPARPVEPAHRHLRHRHVESMPIARRARKTLRQRS